MLLDELEYENMLISINSDFSLQNPPHVMVLEVTNRCNLRCDFCPHDYLLRRGMLQLGDMDWVTYSRLTPFIKKARVVAFTGFGEPYLSRRIFEFIRQTRRYGALTAVTTNGTLLDDIRIIRSIESGLNYMEVSIDGISWNKLHRGTDALRVMERIARVIELREKMESHWPRVYIASVLTAANADEFFQLIDEVPDGVDEIRLQPIQIYFSGQREENPYLRSDMEVELRKLIDYGKERGVRVIVRRSTFSVDERYNPDRNYLTTYHPKLTCIEPFSKMYISWNGSVILCCGGIQTPFNVNTTPLWDIWNSDYYRNWRRGLYTGNLPEQCSGCPQINGSIRNQETIIE